jgi:uncharacterized repeat protein (TIGR02543 family)
METQTLFLLFLGIFFILIGIAVLFLPEVKEKKNNRLYVTEDNNHRKGFYFKRLSLNQVVNGTILLLILLLITTVLNPSIDPSSSTTSSGTSSTSSPSSSVISTSGSSASTSNVSSVSSSISSSSSVDSSSAAPTQYTITFNSNGGTSIDPETLDTGSAISLPTPIRSEHVFQGWFTDESLTQVAPTTMPAQNITLFAKWLINQYQISYEYFSLQRFQSVSTGNRHTLAVSLSGNLYAWGENNFGQLGNGDESLSNQSSPVFISFPGLEDGERIQQAGAANSHSLALTTNGRLFGWGSNAEGQLGLGISGDSETRNTPTLIPFNMLQSGETIQSISVSTSHSFALTTNGRLFGWGRNFNGQLGDGNSGSEANLNSPTLISISGLENGETIQSVNTGVNHTTALTTLGRIFSWGNNSIGQLGSGTNVTRLTPTLISLNGLDNGETIVNITSGTSYSFALTSNGRLYGWGLNSGGQLGDGSNTNRYNPTFIFFDGLENGEKIQMANAGSAQSVAVTTSGRVFVWGLNTNSQLGDGTNVNRNTPTLLSFDELEDGESFVTASVRQHFVAVTTLGRIFGWGYNNVGQVGNGTMVPVAETKNTPTLLGDVVRPSAVRVNNYLAVDYNQPINLPNPTLEGYTFAGWFMDEALTIPYNLTTMPANDVTLYVLFN